MGYDTSFDGFFKLRPELTVKQLDEIDKFAELRHGNDRGNVLDPGCPSLYCQWRVVDGTSDVSGSEGIVNHQAEGQILCWDQSEKFYGYVPWLQLLVDRFFKPWGVGLHGEIEWFGEESDDRGKIVCSGHEIRVFDMVPSYVERKS